MADPVISPDGKMYWDGEQWIPIQNSNQIQTGNIHDSVVQVNNDSEVVRAALDGAAKIINQQTPQQNNQPILIQQPSIQYARIKTINPVKSEPKNPIDKSKIFKWVAIIISLICLTFLAIAVIESQIDSDDDGVVDRKDAFPNDPDEWSDDDDDGVGDNADECPDTDSGVNVDDDGCEIKSQNTPNISSFFTIIVILTALLIYQKKIN